MSDEAVSRSGWFSIISTTATAVVVGFASTILLIMQAAQAVGATPSQQASWAAALCFGQAITTLYLSWTPPDADHHRLVHAGGGAHCHECFRDQLRECAGGLCGGGAAHVPHGADQAPGAGHCADTGAALRRPCWPACC